MTRREVPTQHRLRTHRLERPRRAPPIDRACKRGCGRHVRAAVGLEGRCERYGRPHGQLSGVVGGVCVCGARGGCMREVVVVVVVVGEPKVEAPEG
jgi:hypothetical protein